jgi:hypothetical protein
MTSKRKWKENVEKPWSVPRSYISVRKGTVKNHEYLRIAGKPVEIRIGYIPNTNPPPCSLADLGFNVLMYVRERKGDTRLNKTARKASVGVKSL